MDLSANLPKVVPQVGIEPTYPKALVSETSVSTFSTTGANSIFMVLKGRLELPGKQLLKLPRLPIAPLEQIWCPEPGTIRHALRPRVLRPLRLPIPPSGQACGATAWYRATASCFSDRRFHLVSLGCKEMAHRAEVESATFRETSEHSGH